MFWGCMTSQGVGYGSRIVQRTMDTECYKEILATSFLDTLNFYGLKKSEVLFQHDNDPKHTSKGTKKWLADNKIKYITNWPPNSPDLNPIEHLWKHLKNRLGAYDTRPKNVNELWERVELEWNKFTISELEPYYNSMPKIIASVLKAKGGYTKY